MEMTFTNPFEIVTENLIFGLDSLRNPGNGNSRFRRQVEEPEEDVTNVRIPKYNNYMKKVRLMVISIFDYEKNEAFTNFKEKKQQQGEAAIIIKL